MLEKYMRINIAALKWVEARIQSRIFRQNKLMKARTQFYTVSSASISTGAWLNQRQKPVTVLQEEIRKMRNIGVMAHIDAGKTTTTERMLYFSGYTRFSGDVDDGDTVTDYMEQERERGITITSAAVTFPWNKYQINLIDTPGHIDFTLEVERSLRVMDGVIAVIDASAGVEAQTLTVWKQADRYQIPRMIFVNKMDKFGADFYKSVKSVEEKLRVKPLVLQIPIGVEKTFTGLIDLVTMQKLIWGKESEGKSFTCTDLDSSKDSSLHEQAQEYRNRLIEDLANLDDNIADIYLNDSDLTNISNLEIHNAIRRVTITKGVVPILCGSALKNKGVQPLLDAVIYYLPDPSQQKHEFVDYYEKGMCGLAFKTVHDKKRGALTFVRLYCGSISNGDNIYNINRDCQEKVSRLLQVSGGDYKEVKTIGKGNIAALSGLKTTITGDTLVNSASTAKSAEKSYRAAMEVDKDDDVGDSMRPVLAGLEIPDPVFMCTVEPPSMSHQKQLDYALECLTREDPSLRVNVDSNTGETVISGMGELHLEVIKDRILKDYGVDVYMGEMQISYREAIELRVTDEEYLDKTVAGKKHKVNIKLSVIPTEEDSELGKVTIVPHKDGRLIEKPLRRFHLKAIRNGVKAGLQQGPLLGYAVLNARVEIHDFSMKYGTSVPMVMACTVECVRKACKAAAPILLEPMMRLQISTEEDRVGAILGDLSKRRSQILGITGSDESKTIIARTPLSQMVGYSTALRTLTSGNANFNMEISEYEQVDPAEQQRIFQRLRGYS